MTEPNTSTADESAVVRPGARRTWIVALGLLAVCFAGSQWYALAIEQSGTRDLEPAASLRDPQIAREPDNVSPFGVPSAGIRPGVEIQRPRQNQVAPNQARRAASSEFDNEQRLFEAEIQSLRKRISQLESRLKRRATNRDRLIERKLKRNKQGTRSKSPRQDLDSFDARPTDGFRSNPSDDLRPNTSPNESSSRSPFQPGIPSVPAPRGNLDAFGPSTRTPSEPPQAVPPADFNGFSSEPAEPVPSDSPASPRDSFRDALEDTPIDPMPRRDRVRANDTFEREPATGFDRMSPTQPEEMPRLDRDVVDETFADPESWGVPVDAVGFDASPPVNGFDRRLGGEPGVSYSRGKPVAAISPLLAALHQQFRDLRQRLGTTTDDNKRARLQEELLAVTKLASLQLGPLEALASVQKLRIEQFRQADAQLKRAGVKDDKVLNGFKNEWKQVTDSIRQIQDRVDQAKAPFFERSILLPSSGLPLAQFVQVLGNQTGIKFRLGTAVDGLQLTPSRDAVARDELVDPEQGDAPTQRVELQTALRDYLKKLNLTHRNEINPKSGELICVIVHSKFDFDQTPLATVLQVYSEAMGVGYEMGPDVPINTKVTTQVGSLSRRHLRPLLNTVGLDYRVEESLTVPGGEMFKIFRIDDAKNPSPQENALEPEPPTADSLGPSAGGEQPAPLPPNEEASDDGNGRG